MRKTAKIISLLLTLAMMLTMALPMTVSAAFSDVPTSHHYYDAITNLSAEGILNGFEDGTFKPGDPVTRAQFTKIICYALSVGDLTYTEEERSIFTDLAPEHWAANNIVTAYNQGIINGMGDGTFAPEAGVQYEQAVKMVVCALGYSQARADALGGYPGGYMSLANSAKLLNGINDAKMYEVMNRGAVAQLIDNMLDADQIQDGQPSGSIRDEVSTSKSVEGQLVAGYGVSLYSDTELEACRKNEVIVELGSARWTFDVSSLNGFDIYEYLGRSVTVYYEVESGVSVPEVSSIALQPRKNETVKIELDMIYDYDSSSIEYYTDADRTETEIVDFQIDADVLWNGQYDARSIEELLDYDSNYLKPGYITLVSSQTNQSADVAFLKTYDTIVVDTVDTNNAKVYAKNVSGSFVLDVTDRSKSVSITMNGADYALSAIRANHILSISQSANGKVIEVLVSTKVATGTIESMTTTPQHQIKLNTGNTVYTVSPGAYDGSDNGASASTALLPGKYVTISLDAFGKVARFLISAESSYNYGYISALEHGTQSRPEIQVMIYKPATSNSTLTGTVYTFAPRVKVDGTNYNVEDDMNTILGILSASATAANANLNSDIAQDTSDESTLYSQPVRYTLDRSNQIDSILTVNSPSGDGSNELRIVDKTNSGIVCKVDGTTFDQYRISGSTPILYIPTDRGSSSFSSKNNTFFDEGETYYVQFANVSGTNVVGCVYLYGVVGSESGDITAQITEENKPLIVLDRSQKSHLDNVETYIKVKDITTGDEYEYYENTIDLDTLAIGDVVRLAIGADNYVDEIEILADADGVVAGTYNYGGDEPYAKYDGDGTGIMAEFRALLATVKSKDSSTFVVVPGYDGSADIALGETFTASESLPIYKIDPDAANVANKVTTSSVGELIGYASDASSASNVLIYTVEGEIKGIIIFE